MTPSFAFTSKLPLTLEGTLTAHRCWTASLFWAKCSLHFPVLITATVPFSVYKLACTCFLNHALLHTEGVPTLTDASSEPLSPPHAQDPSATFSFCWHLHLSHHAPGCPELRRFALIPASACRASQQPAATKR